MPPCAQNRRSRGGGCGPGRGAGPSHDAGPGRGGPPQPAHRRPPAHMTGVRRPDYGSSGRAINIHVNSFTTEIPDGTICHYDVVVSADKVLPAATNMRLIKALQYHAAPEIITDIRRAFGGRKNFYASVELVLGGDSHKFISSDRPPRIYKICRGLVATINTEIFHRFIRGQQSHDTTVSIALMVYSSLCLGPCAHILCRHNLGARDDPLRSDQGCRTFF
ncbi:hypothetical protein DFH08DRAFT_888690 [Mycena albidolilacea]|uniref:Protein argonaute N-terminal domain-containing protein n=1 Tax=Mycena albidolilacea TaxID=1033008 RepID=A0AAD6ZHD8_9AGAR|nr:hypothetical protein DFH08DRAFT_888690 [Mycena albidolilacea]